MFGGRIPSRLTMTTTYLDDRRIYERYSARFPVRYKDMDQGYGTNIFLRDVSAEGARLISKERVFLNDSLSILVELPDGHDPISLNGQIVWNKPMSGTGMWHVGLRFHKVDFMNIHRFMKYVSIPI